MKIHFYKYQGAGNDFIMIDNRSLTFPVSTELINSLCDRRFGIGADGLILLQRKEGYDYEMVYFNSDGNPSTMCGNGGRCLVAFAKDIEVGGVEQEFLAVDGPHRAYQLAYGITLQMKDVDEIIVRGDDFVLNTGSPHYVRFAEDIKDMDVVTEARKIRHNEEFDKEGINVNFVQHAGGNHIKLRTFERGVEDETLACGTGVVASALAWFAKHSKDKRKARHQVNVEAMGGKLDVKFNYDPETHKFSEVWLTGPADYVFEGDINI